MCLLTAKYGSFRRFNNYNFAFAQLLNYRIHHILFVMENIGIINYIMNSIEIKQNIILFATVQAINSSLQLLHKVKQNKTLFGTYFFAYIMNYVLYLLIKYC